MSVWDSLDAKTLKVPPKVDFGPIVEPPARPVDIPQEESQDITIGGGAQGTEQQTDREMLDRQKFVDQMNDTRFSGTRKSNLI